MYTIEQRDEQLLGTQAKIRYHCFFDRAAEHLLRVRMEIDLDGGEDDVRCTLPAWAPGSYKIRDFITHVGNLHVYNDSGTLLPVEWIAKSTFRFYPRGAKMAAVEYVFYANERSVRTMHITRWRAFLFPVNCFFYVEGRQQEVHHVILHFDRSRWQSLTTALSPVTALNESGGPVILGALNYDILADSPTEIGNHLVRSFTAWGARHEVALVAPYAFDIDWLAEQCRIIVETEAAVFGGVPYDRYVFFVYAGTNISGGLEHARCSVNMCDVQALHDPQKAKSLLALLCHEYFHVWNIKRIRPREYGPFDYTKEVHSPMLWLAEGFTSYYDDLFAYRAGFYTREEYLDLLARDHIGKLLQVPGRRAMSVRQSSYLAWVKLYAQSPDGQNRFPSYYLKGGVVALLLDLAIIESTEGRRRLDDVMRVLWQHYCQRPEIGLTEEEVLQAIEEVSTAEVRKKFWQWIDSTDELDIATAFAPFGIEWIEQPKDSQQAGNTTPYLGLQLKTEGGRLIVSSVMEGSPASKAGIAVDDELIAVNGKRITTEEELLRAFSWGDKVTEITASCDGQLYTTTIEYMPAMDYQLRVRPVLSERQQKLFQKWLERSFA
ncbi:MAG: PDZ domain-containing protein [Candidatus Kapabacteria bacterium]|nr:PDZ domain-containing protein [Candidatus Kapabacteria bacterium]